MAGQQPPSIGRLDRLLTGTVEAHPASAALITGAERTPVTYLELATLVEDLAGQLTANGLQAGDLVALEATNSVELVAGLLGASRAGLVVAPIDPALPQKERTTRLDRLGARVVLTDALSAGPDGACPTWRLTFTPGRAGLQVAASGPPRPRPPGAPRLEADDALVMFTAGTTGQPKMVPWTHQSIAAVVGDICACYQLGSTDAAVAVMPFFHGHGLIAGLLGPLASGGRLLLPARGRFSAHTFWDDLAAAEATWLTAVPTILEILLTRAQHDRPLEPPSRLRFVRTCSAPLSSATARAFSQLVDAPVLAAYGMTETTHQATSQALPGNGPDRAGTVGRPTGVELRIVDEAGHDRAAGQVGEVWIKGPTVTRGYLADPAATAASLTDGWYRTGDLGRVDTKGCLTVTGRIKTLINRGGEKISPEHVEEILDQHPAVAESAVLGQPDPTLGERVVALLVLASGQDLQSADVAAYCRDRLARYEVPEDIKVVDAIPHTPKGAIDRTAALTTYERRR